MAKKKDDPYLIDFFKLLDLFESAKKITKSDKTKTFCAQCGKSHFRQWYINNKTGERFYICTISNKIVINYLEDHWVDFEPLYLINQLIP